MSNCSDIAPVCSPVKEPILYHCTFYGYLTRLPSVWRLEKSFLACHKNCDMQLHSTVLCFGSFNKDRERSSSPPNSLQIWFYLFVFSLAFAPVSLANSVYTEKWNALPELLLPSFCFPLSCPLFFPPLSFIPMCGDAWVMKSSLSVWPAHLCFSLLPPLQPLCPSMLIWPTNSVQVWQTRALLNSGQTASSLCLLAACLPVCVLPHCGPHFTFLPLSPLIL